MHCFWYSFIHTFKNVCVYEETCLLGGFQRNVNSSVAWVRSDGQSYHLGLALAISWWPSMGAWGLWARPESASWVLFPTMNLSAQGMGSGGSPTLRLGLRQITELIRGQGCTRPLPMGQSVQRGQMNWPTSHSMLVAEPQSHNPRLARLPASVGDVHKPPVRGLEPVQGVNLTLPIQHRGETQLAATAQDLSPTSPQH